MPSPDARIRRRTDDVGVSIPDTAEPGAITPAPADPAVPVAPVGAEMAVADPSIPADPVAYDTERNLAARRRGLAAPYIPGGRDPDQERAEREDRRYLRLLVIMVLVIVLAGFVLGILAELAGLTGLVGNPG